MSTHPIGRMWLALPWLIVSLAVPVVGWWLFEPMPVTIDYVHPYFVSVPVMSREAAAANEVYEVRGGGTVYRYIEFTIHRPYSATAHRSWVNDALVWNSPDFATVLTHDLGHHHSSIAVSVPTSSPTRSFNFVQSLTIPMNPIRTEELVYPPIPLTILDNKQ